MSVLVPAFNSSELSLDAAGVRLTGLVPLIDGEPVAARGRLEGQRIEWPLSDGPGQRLVLTITVTAEAVRLDLVLEGLAPEVSIGALGVRIGKAEGVLRYLRNGYTSWDGSYFIEPESAREVLDTVSAATCGHAMSVLVAKGGATVLGFLRHDRYQSRLRFDFSGAALCLDVESLIDHVPHQGRVATETLVLLADTEVEAGLRRWARSVAQAAPLAPRVHHPRITGWCSWYNLYGSISEPVLLEHLRAAARFRDEYQVPFRFFQIDDGFVPEMGDWLDVKPQFPRGMAPLLADIRAAGFVPGLWIAPFMVGNRSRLFAEHPDWVVMERQTGKPIAPMKFYGEFRWHKRSEEYYVLDVTHPGAEAWIREVLRVWARDWGCGYFKTDFMYFGAEYGPERVSWHRPGLSRMEVWMRMARLIREEIGDAVWLGCGGPVWAPVGLMDAVRIGRDIGVSWHGHYSAESLLRDQTTRNFANGILWQADPDCILLRDRFHDLTEPEVRSLALFAGLSGGVLMTSDQLDEVPAERRALFADLARGGLACEFPQLGSSTLEHRVVTGHAGQPVVVSSGDPVLLQRVRRGDGVVLVNVFNTGDSAAERLIPWSEDYAGVSCWHGDCEPVRAPEGVRVVVPAHASCVLAFTTAYKPNTFSALV